MTSSYKNNAEWLALHKSYDQFEAYSLILKIVSIVLFTVSFVVNIAPIIFIFVLLVLWLQESIWKTFQARTEQRLIQIETTPDESISFYSDWSNNRPGTMALVMEYIKQAFRPTIAYPYAVLILATLLLSAFS